MANYGTKTGKYSHHAGPGRPKGSKSARYVTIESLVDAIQGETGKSFQELYAELLGASRQDWLTGTDRQTYPRFMMSTANKIVENPKQIVENTTGQDLDDMTDEQLEAEALRIANLLTGDQNVSNFPH